MRKATSSAAGLMAVLAAVAPLASAFTCTWRGGDYSWFTYYEEIPRDCCTRSDGVGCNGYGYSEFCDIEFYESCFDCDGGGSTTVCCDTPFSKQYALEVKTQCCQCAGDTVYNPFSGYPFNDFNDQYVLTQSDCNLDIPFTRFDEIGEIQGCDGFDPEVQTSNAAAQARSPGEWFTSEEQLTAYLEQTITCEDDCWDLGDSYYDATPTDPSTCTFYWDDNCANTVVTATAIDRCGNTASNSFSVRYDVTPPTVDVTLGSFTQGKYKQPFEEVDLTVTVNDVCDPNPLVTIDVFSDEAPLIQKLEPSAVLGRTYSTVNTNAVISGWRLTLNRNYLSHSSGMDKAFTTPNMDGRFYTVRVCAKDLAGFVACDEAYVSVPNKRGANAHKVLTSPVNNGKLYSVASDIVYWNAPQTEMPFRLQNTGLTAP